MWGNTAPLLHWAILRPPKAGRWPPTGSAWQSDGVCCFVIASFLWKCSLWGGAASPLCSRPVSVCTAPFLPSQSPSVVPQHKTTLREPVSLYATFQAHLITDNLKIKHLFLNLFCVGKKKWKSVSQESQIDIPRYQNPQVTVTFWSSAI